MTTYQIYDTTTGARLWDCFTPEFAKVKLARLTAIGRRAACREVTPPCSWGDCQNRAEWFYSADYGFKGSLCGEHYKPEWFTEMVAGEEKIAAEAA